MLGADHGAEGVPGPGWLDSSRRAEQISLDGPAALQSEIQEDDEKKDDYDDL